MRVKYREKTQKYSAIINQTGSVSVTNNNDCDPSNNFIVDISDKIITSNLIPELQERVEIIFQEEREHIQESSSIVNDMRLPIHYDSDRQTNFVILSKIPMGDIISCIVTIVDAGGDRTNVAIDGLFNVAGKRLEFFTEGVNQFGNTAEVKYLVRL